MIDISDKNLLLPQKIESFFPSQPNFRIYNIFIKFMSIYSMSTNHFIFLIEKCIIFYVFCKFTPHTHHIVHRTECWMWITEKIGILYCVESIGKVCKVWENILMGAQIYSIFFVCIISHANEFHLFMCSYEKAIFMCVFFFFPLEYIDVLVTCVQNDFVSMNSQPVLHKLYK